MKVAFAGTPDFAADVLRRLLGSEHEVGVVISQPDAGRGRGRKVVPTPVADLAASEGLTLLQPERIGEVAGEISRHDALVVAAYGQILRADTLYAATHDAWNVHASLLPAYRGAAPIERSLMNGETETGVSIMRMEEGLDTGPVALQRSCAVPEDMNSGGLTETLARIGADALVEVLGSIEAGSLSLAEQDEQKATYAPKLTPQDRVISWSLPAKEIHDRIRALAPGVGARTFHPQFSGPVKILRSKIVDGEEAGTEPGELVPSADRLLVKCGRGSIEVEMLQAPGKKPLPAKDFLQGRTLTGSFRDPREN